VDGPTLRHSSATPDAGPGPSLPAPPLPRAHLAGVDKLVVRRPGSRLGAQAPPAPPPGPPCPRGLQAGPAIPQPPRAGPAGPRAAQQYRHVAQRRPQHAARRPPRPAAILEAGSGGSDPPRLPAPVGGQCSAAPWRPAVSSAAPWRPAARAGWRGVERGALDRDHWRRRCPDRGSLLTRLHFKVAARVRVPQNPPMLADEEAAWGGRASSRDGEGWTGGRLGALGVGVVAARGVLSVRLPLPRAELHLPEGPLPAGDGQRRRARARMRPPPAAPPTAHAGPPAVVLEALLEAPPALLLLWGLPAVQSCVLEEGRGSACGPHSRPWGCALGTRSAGCAVPLFR